LEDAPNVSHERVRITVRLGQGRERVAAIKSGEQRGGRFELAVVNMLGKLEIGLEVVARLGRATAVAEEACEGGAAE
jgi:hypothetical protein